MPCLNCKSWKPDGTLNALGLSTCVKRERWLYLPAHHACAKWEAEDAVAVKKRIAWFHKLGLLLCGLRKAGG